MFYSLVWLSCNGRTGSQGTQHAQNWSDWDQTSRCGRGQTSNTHTQSEVQNPNTKTGLVGPNSKSRKLLVLCPKHMEAPASRDQTRTQLILLRMLWGGYRLTESGLQNRDASSHSKESEGKQCPGRQTHTALSSGTAGLSSAPPTAAGWLWPYDVPQAQLAVHIYPNTTRVAKSISFYKRGKQQQQQQNLTERSRSSRGEMGLTGRPRMKLSTGEWLWDLWASLRGSLIRRGRGMAAGYADWLQEISSA